jgi:hypothetical protein
MPGAVTLTDDTPLLSESLGVELLGEDEATAFRLLLNRTEPFPFSGTVTFVNDAFSSSESQDEPLLDEVEGAAFRLMPMWIGLERAFSLAATANFAGGSSRPE